jgi:hypothetical protein
MCAFSVLFIPWKAGGGLLEEISIDVFVFYYYLMTAGFSSLPISSYFQLEPKNKKKKLFLCHCICTLYVIYVLD